MWRNEVEGGGRGWKKKRKRRRRRRSGRGSIPPCAGAVERR